MEQSGWANDDQVAFEAAGGFVIEPSCHLGHATLDEPTTIAELDALLATGPPRRPRTRRNPRPWGFGGSYVLRQDNCARGGI